MLRFCWVLLLLSGCVLTRTAPTPLPTLPATLAPVTPIPIPTIPLALTLPEPTPLPAEGWEILAPGLEQRMYVPDGNMLAQLVVVRIDPTYYTFRAHYRPSDALNLDLWRETLPDAAVIINANFFSTAEIIQGLLVSDGFPYGQTFTDRGGMFLVQNGAPRVRSNLLEPYWGEPLEQAVQGFPMLVTNGQTAEIRQESNRATRRTAIGQDSQGRIILMATPLLGLGLLDLSAYLPTTDLGLVYAFNLDGGGSTMLSIRAPGHRDYTLPAFDAVPAVLAAYPRPA